MCFRSNTWLRQVSLKLVVRNQLLKNFKHIQTSFSPTHLFSVEPIFNKIDSQNPLFSNFEQIQPFVFSPFLPLFPGSPLNQIEMNFLDIFSSKSVVEINFIRKRKIQAFIVVLFLFLFLLLHWPIYIQIDNRDEFFLNSKVNSLSPAFCFVRVFFFE